METALTMRVPAGDAAAQTGGANIPSAFPVPLSDVGTEPPSRLICSYVAPYSEGEQRVGEEGVEGRTRRRALLGRSSKGWCGSRGVRERVRVLVGERSDDWGKRRRGWAAGGGSWSREA